MEKKRRDIDEAIEEYSQRGRLTIEILRSMVQGRTIQGKSKEDDFFSYAEKVINDEYRMEKIGVSVRDNALCGFSMFRKFLRAHTKPANHSNREPHCLIGGHGGTAGKDAVEFKIDYLTTMKKALADNKTEEGFIEAMKKAYPGLAGENNLTELAKTLYKK